MREKKYNALYSCCISEPWLDVVKKLDDELNITPSYFIGWEADNSHKIRDSYSECFYQTVEDAWIGLGFPDIEYRFHFDENLLKSISFEKLIALNMMDRLDLNRGSFSFDNREIFFNRLFKYWFTIIEKYNIELIISPSVPHRVFDYILYIVAKVKNIEFIMFQMTPFGTNSFIINDIDATPKYIKSYLNENRETNLVLRDDIAKKIATIKQNYEEAKPDYMVEQQKEISNHSFIEDNILRVKNLYNNPLSQFQKNSSYYIMKKDDLPYQKSYLNYERKINIYSNRRYLRRLKREYDKITIQPNYNQKYVFVALHYQPEETSIPTGGSFGNQTLIIELLNTFLDKSYNIYIKEHSTQFHPKYEGAMGRNIHFYNEILSISDRIGFIDVEADPFSLIDNSVATATISGTIGWESAIRGTPTLIFGRAWYEDMLGVFKIKSLKDLTDNWSEILKLKNSIPIKEIENYHNSLQNFFIDAVHYKSFQNENNQSNEENSINIYRGIQKHLEQIKFNKRVML